MIALIDADSLVYVLAYVHRELSPENALDVKTVETACDVFLRDILLMTDATAYIGVFGDSTKNLFRTKVYQYANYKGNRGPKTEYMIAWETVIRQRFINEHGFFLSPMMEADDVLSGVAEEYQLSNTPHIICSPDKDLRQIPGIHYDYRAISKEADGGGTVVATPFNVSTEEAFWNLWRQMLMGDTSDNVAGLPGIGEVKARKFLAEIAENGEHISTYSRVKDMYSKYFGLHYGPLIFMETYQTILMLCKAHPAYTEFGSTIRLYAETAVRKLKPAQGVFDT